MLDVATDGVLERKQFRLAAINREHRGGKRRFERGVLEEVVDDDLRVCVALEINNHTCLLVGFVADGADVGDDFLIHQIRDALDEHRAVHVVGNLGNDELLASAFHFGDADFSTHTHSTFAGVKIRFDPRGTEDFAARREVRSFDVFHQSFDGDVRVVNLRAHAVNYFGEIVRGHVRRHADGDAGAAVDEEIWKSCGQHRGFLPRLVVVGHEVHRVLVHVLHQRRAEVLQTRLGITHGSWRVALNAAEVPLPLDEHFSHRPMLRHVDERRVNRLIAVRMVVTHRLADDLRALEWLAGRPHTQLGHGEKNAPLRRF